MTTEFGTGQATGDSGDAAAMDAIREAMDAISASEPDFCQIFCSPTYDYEAVLWGARSVVGSDTEIVGCSSSGEFTEAGSGNGTVTVGVVSSDSIQFFSSLSTELSADPERCLFEAVHDLPASEDPAVDGYPHRTLINLHDGMAGIGNKVTRLTEQYLDDEETPVVGGSAGDDLQLQQTHVFRNDRVETDAVVLALIASEDPLPVTVNHGHEPISEAMTVTRAEGSTVYELDGRPAFEAWRDAIREDAMETYDIDVDELEAGSEDSSCCSAATNSVSSLNRTRMRTDSLPESRPSSRVNSSRRRDTTSDGRAIQPTPRGRWTSLSLSPKERKWW